MIVFVYHRNENCLIENGTLIEYFLIELIQIEHSDIRKRLFSHTIPDNQSDDDSNESTEQKSKLSKVIDEIEQCIYCLYGLILRKSKMKYLNDHNCSSVNNSLLIKFSIQKKIINNFYLARINLRKSKHRFLCFTTKAITWI